MRLSHKRLSDLVRNYLGQLVIIILSFAFRFQGNTLLAHCEGALGRGLVGTAVGCNVGFVGRVGLPVGALVGRRVGIFVGCLVVAIVGFLVS